MGNKLGKKHHPRVSKPLKLKPAKTEGDVLSSIISKKKKKKSLPPPSTTALSAPPVPEPPAREKQLVGRAVVLAHGAGGSSSHSSMKQWKQRLAHLCDAVYMVDFPRPYQLSTQGSAFLEAMERAHRAGHRRIVLAGVGMGARVVAQMLSGAGMDAADEHAPVIPAELRECLVGLIALGYPLAKGGDAALRGLPESTPPLLLVAGSNDAQADLDALEAAQRDCACPAKCRLHKVIGCDHTLKLASGTHLEKEAAAALDGAFATFLLETLGSAAESTEIWVETAARGAPAPMSAAASMAAYDERARENWLQQTEAKRLLKEERRAEVERQRQAAAEARAARAQAAAQAAGQSAPAMASIEATPRALILTGCGSAEVNGRYELDGERGGFPCYRMARGGETGDAERTSFTIERDAAEGQQTQWCLCVDYGFESWCFVDSDGDLPPASGWQCGETCDGPAPTLASADSDIALPAEPELRALDDDMQHEAGGDMVDLARPSSGATMRAKHKRREDKKGVRMSKGSVKKMNALKRKGK